MDLNDARTMADTMIEHYELDGWVFRFDNAQRRLGLCVYSRKTISMGRVYVVAADLEHVRQTMLHEIAHALLGPAHGHDAAWRATAASIGYTGKRTADNPHADAQRANALERAQAIAPDLVGRDSGDLRVGERVRMTDGRHPGLLVKANRTTFDVVSDTTGRTIRIPATLLQRENEGGPAIAVTAPLTSRRVGLRIGQGIVIHKPGSKWHNLTGTIERVNGASYSIVSAAGRLRAPKSLVQAV